MRNLYETYLEVTKKLGALGFLLSVNQITVTVIRTLLVTAIQTLLNVKGLSKQS